MATHPAPATGLARGGMAILRLALGAVFTVHGAQKLFVTGLPAVTGWFVHAGIPHAGITGPGVALLEFAGGIALLVGLATRVFALLFAIEMAGAIYFVHASNGFFAPNGFEYPLTLCAASVTLALVGPGVLSLDGVFLHVRRRADRESTMSEKWLAHAGRS